VTAQPSPDLPDSLRRDRKAAGEDVHQAAAEAYQAALSPPVDGAPVALTAADMRLRRLGAAVDEAVRLTEQRVRAEIGAAAEQPRYIPFRDPLPESVHRRVLLTPEMFFDYDADGQLVGMGTTCGATALMRALGAMAPDLLAGADELAAMTARAEAAKRRLAVVVDVVREAAYVADPYDVTDWQRGYRAACARITGALDSTTRPLDDVAPETGLSSTETGVQATVEGKDANGPQDSSGGAA
jgi:hypothetical protein